jgi:hypothetical protein
VHVRTAVLAALAVGLAACGSHSPTAADLGSTTGVPCAGAECAPCADQFCDTADFGKTGSCRAHVAPNNQTFGCDGPEDCVTQGVFGACCLIDGIGAACSTAGCGSSARFMCHQDGDCAAGEHCCVLAAGTSYSACKAGC